MKKARGSVWDTMGIFTALQSSMLVARAAGADLYWDWLGTDPLISPLPVALSN
jgi:hypothetical protein